MNLFHYKTLFLLAALSSASAQILPTTKFAEVTSSLTITSTTVGPVNYYSIGMTVSYPINLPPASYISAAQLSTDFQNAVAAYPTPQDPQEAILSKALLTIIQKYPQIIGASLIASPPGPSIGGFAVPSGDAIEIEIINPTSQNATTFSNNSLLTHDRLSKRR